jgi:hypothetical protein
MRKITTDRNSLLLVKPPKKTSILWMWPVAALWLFGGATTSAQASGEGDYRFNVESETCQDSYRKAGLHKKVVGECGDIRKMKFEMSNYQGANFMGSDMRKTVFRMSNMNSANLQFTDLRGADLRSAELKGANFGRSDLRKAKLNAADLTRASLIGVDLRGADLSGVVFRRSKIINSDLRDTVLDLVDLREATLRQVLLPEDVDPNILPPNYRPTSVAEFSLDLERRNALENLGGQEEVSLLEQLLLPLIEDSEEDAPEEAEETPGQFPTDQ